MAERGTPGAKVVSFKKSSCPMCKRPTVTAFRPFCSRRCADLDLGRWLKGDYRIPASLEEGDEGVDAEDAEDPDAAID